MKQVQFTEFRRNASAIFSAVEKGESFEVLRHGRLIARIVPASEERLPAWKRPRQVLAVKGVSLSETIMKERRESER